MKVIDRTDKELLDFVKQLNLIKVQRPLTSNFEIWKQKQKENKCSR